MSALFDVPGWSVPSAPVSTQRQSRKRKRTAAGTSSEEQDLLRNAQANLDKLVESLGGSVGSVGLGDDPGDTSNTSRKKTRAKKSTSHRVNDQPQEGSHPQRKPKNKSKTAPTGTPSTSDKVASPKKKAKNVEQHITPGHPPAADTAGLTSLQRNLKKNLNGARFRLLNETLYKSSSHEAVKMMKEDPQTFEDYHVGFRTQVQSWPSNPVRHYIRELSSYPPKTVIADLGCGDAALARALFAKKFTILSFDLVSDGNYVIEADICSRIPLPGSEPQSVVSNQGEAQVVDVVVCALSLMSTNWPVCIREAWRILRPGGGLKIAEVASRFSNVHDFISLITSVGFKSTHKDDRNSHFTLFQFEKIARPMISEDEWTSIMARGRILSPCEYKRR